MAIRIEQGGMLTTVQDGGRVGYQQLGVTVCGAVDPRSLAVGNLLVGNPENEAALEATVAGPRIAFEADAVFAITGGNLSPQLNGVAVEHYRALTARAGDVLSFGVCRGGCRAYIAVAGGFGLSPVMGSLSTDLRTGIGGVEGRALRAGDRIPLRAPVATLPGLGRRWLEPEDFDPPQRVLRTVPGPQDDHFTAAGLAAFFGETYTVSGQFDRMGCRLEGAAVQLKGDGDIVSDGVAMGSVQVPGGGKPIVMLADRQTTGGYAKIATVISDDIPLIAQCRGGEKIRFRQVSVEEAQQAYRARRDWLNALPRRWEQPEQPEQPATRTFTVSVNGCAYRVEVTQTQSGQPAG